MTVCRTCKQEKASSEFYARPVFKACVNDQFRLSTYGITPGELARMRIDQENRCAICREEFTSDKHTHIDHDHESLTVRGILCGKCNCGLGMFRDDANILKNAIEYLEEKSGVRILL